VTITIRNGDCRNILQELPDESVHCVVTSPPYWGLRDYGVAGQLGMEASLGEYVDVMVDVFREVRRVLRKDGTLWLNLGDSYAAQINGRSAHDTKLKGMDDRTFRDKPFSTIGNGLKPKDLCGIPWRVAFALQADGWWLRQDIIWSKPNPMPESVTDRCTKSHEYLFLLTKSKRYYYDAEAIAEAANYPEGPGNIIPCKGAGDPFMDTRGNLYKIGPRATRNRRSVWEVTTQPFSEAHFATFPPELPRRCILAGCPPGGVVLDPFMGSGTTARVAAHIRFRRRGEHSL